MRFIFILFFFLQFFPQAVFSEEALPVPEEEQPLERLNERLAEGMIEEELPEEGKKKEVATEPAVMQIKRLETEEPLYSFELRNVDLKDLFRVLAHDYKLNILMDEKVQGQITASFSNISLEEAIDAIAENQNFILKKKGNIIKVSPNLITRTFKLKHIEAEKLFEKGPSTSVSDLLSENGRILLGSQPNSIMVIDYQENIDKIEVFLKMADERMQARIFKLRYLSASELAGEGKKKAGEVAEGVAGEGAVAMEEVGVVSE
ncbi:MAG: hypothetical protein ABIH40_05815 [Candidatus Omnitrophota bacterium]